MRLFLSADIEGVTGIAHWDEASLQKPTFRSHGPATSASTRHRTPPRAAPE